MNRTNKKRTFIKNFPALKTKDGARWTRRMIGKTIHGGQGHRQMMGRRIAKMGMNNRKIMRFMNTFCTVQRILIREN